VSNKQKVTKAKNLVGADVSVRPLHKTQSGQATVEFALVVPFLMIALLVLVQTGLTMHAQVVVTQAAREGARQATTAGSGGEIVQAVRRSAGSLNSGRLKIAYKAPHGWKVGEPVTVTVSYGMPVLLPLIGKIFPNSLILKSSTTMRIEKDR
jgi:hypothetical protein